MEKKPKSVRLLYLWRKSSCLFHCSPISEISWNFNYFCFIDRWIL